MKFNKTLLGAMVGLAVSTTLSTTASAQQVSVDVSKLKSNSVATKAAKSSGNYIVQLKGEPAISRAAEIGELIPSNQLVAVGNRYNGQSEAMQAYTQALQAKQDKVAADAGNIRVLNQFVHTFNGFSAKLTENQVEVLQNHPDVVSVYADEVFVPETANTPEFLGLTAEGGQHAENIKGEGVIVGILDTGIDPDNGSFADDGSYSDPAELGWTGICDVNTDETFTCNNKLIGARYFKESFESTYEIQTALGEFISPRDADGHGSHTAGTAAGNEGVSAFINGVSVGSVTGIAPRARVAAYKVCWNSDYVSPEGVDEAGCFFGDSMAAIDQAVLDGVDVINYSIGNSVELTTPVYLASLAASEAGVFFSGSAGNSGPGPETARSGAPWTASVAASTYDGISALVGQGLVVLEGETNPGDTVLSIAAGFGPSLPGEGLPGSLAIYGPDGDNNLACDGDPTGADITGQIALISRGACAFTEKVLNAQDAGAIGVVVYSTTDSPFAMGGNDPAVAIPSVMIARSDGLSLVERLSGEATDVVMGTDPTSSPATEVGNIMADFSSRGPNLSTTDLIKPDITAPGVRILAATTSTPMFGTQGETQAYLQGTSMSSPHIAGMAALLTQQHPTWTPAQIKSALMTTAYQEVVKEDGVTPADPFDFGSGHASPVQAGAPGLTYQANTGDYLAFMCGLDEESFVEGFGTDCATLEGSGFATDPSQLNYPSIAIGELLTPETVSRTLTDVSGLGGVYSAVITPPPGIDVELSTFDSEGVETETGDLEVPANGTASYSLTFTKNESAVVNEWTFGSITFSDGVHTVRSPIAIFPAPEVDIIVPETVSLELNRNRASFPVQMLYSGSTSMDYAGLSPAFGIPGNAPEDPDQTFDFVEGLDTAHFFHVFPGTKVLRFSLADALVDLPEPTAVDGADLDLYVYSCSDFSCNEVGSSLNASSNEDVVLVNPEPQFDSANGNLYIVFVHAWSTGGNASVDYVMPSWFVDTAESTTRITGSRRAIDGRFNQIRINAPGLDPEMLYMGGVTFYNADGEAQGTTVLEVQP